MLETEKALRARLERLNARAAAVNEQRAALREAVVRAGISPDILPKGPLRVISWPISEMALAEKEAALTRIEGEVKRILENGEWFATRMGTAN